MRIVFMGSPALAVPSLKAAMETGQVVGIVTQPPKMSGRGRKMTPSPVSDEAAGMGIRILTPESLKNPEVEEEFKSMAPDIAVVVAYGKILPPGILTIPRLGCVNVHASILPELRGAAPIQWAIARGYTETGVTLMQMDEGMDTGPILLQSKTPIRDQETAGDLGKRLADMGADLVRNGLPLLERGEVTPVEQDGSRATYAPLLKKSDGFIDWSLGADEIANRVRGFRPWPGTWTTMAGNRLIVVKAIALEKPSGDRPGAVITADASGLSVSCGRGTLEILAVKPDGKREMNVQEFISGHKINIGEILGL
ncbi:MAG: methionyl-tRNA formyltransferase [Pseudomonadota bacterium]|jgi:methionyl-tRNA formyltransferase